MLAQLDEGWDGSVRRAALYALLLGPRDWTTQAAIVALTRLASEEEAWALDIHEAFTRLDAARPDSGFVTYEHALFAFWLDLPHLYPNEREELVAKLEALDDEE